jgi:hypothetical protein
MNPIEIVVCRYREQPDWIKAAAEIFPVTLFNKGEPDLCDVGRAFVCPARNVGRETQAWFEFLQARPEDRFARHTIFLQADPAPHTGDHPFEVLGKLVSLAMADVLYAPVSNMEIVCDQDGEPHHRAAGPNCLRTLMGKVWGARM